MKTDKFEFIIDDDIDSDSDDEFEINSLYIYIYVLWISFIYLLFINYDVERTNTISE